MRLRIRSRLDHLVKYVIANKRTRKIYHRNEGRVLFITGVRSGESEIRMGRAVPASREGCTIWLAPIINWDSEDKTVYQIANDIPRNPVTTVLGISGECLCGAFCKPGERAKIEQHFPAAGQLIAQCESRAAANCKPSSWGERPLKTQHLCQQCERKNGGDPE